MANFIFNALKKSHVAVHGHRSFHSSIYCCKEARILSKLLKTSSKKKHRYVDMEVLSSPSIFTKGSLEGKRSLNSKRANVLNKLFMKHITDLMISGENSSQFVGHGIEINQVQVTPDYKLVKVYWINNGNENDAVIDEILKKNAGPLRHELTQLRVVGVMPKIQFMKDVSFIKVAEIDSCLSKLNLADSSDYVDKLKTKYELNIPLKTEIKEKITQLEEVYEDDCETPIPPMPQNVLGLNHDIIMSKIKKSLKKSEAKHRTSPQSDESVEVTQIFNKNPVNLEDAKAEREAFKKFLQQRQILKSKMKKEQKNYIPDMEYIKEEMMEKQQQYYDNIAINHNFVEDKDYVDEHEEEEEEETKI